MEKKKLTKNDIKIASTNMERFSTLLTIRKMQIKISKMSFLPIILAKIPKFVHTLCS